MKKRFRFSIFFRGCNQYKFIHITGAKIITFPKTKKSLSKKFAWSGILGNCGICCGGCGSCNGCNGSIGCQFVVMVVGQPS